MTSEPCGLVVVDKPAGPTSHDVVNRVRRVIGIKRVGHAGTLDPAATGILLVGIGRATRLLQFLQRLAKSYRTTARFGVSTSTQDAEGSVTAERICSFGPEDLASALSGFLGEIEQIPPMASAVKVGGEALHKAHRRGESVERAPRSVHVYELELEKFDADKWQAQVFVSCSSGTYVRTLVSDLGDRLGCGAHVSHLRRVSVGSFAEQDAVSLDHLEEDPLRWILPPKVAMRDFPSIQISEDELELVQNGRPLAGSPASRAGEMPVVASLRSGDVPSHEAGMTAGVPVGVIDPRGDLVAVYRKHRNELRASVVLL